MAGEKVLHALKYNGSHPVWDANLIGVMRGMIAAGESLSCADYPHSAEDIRLAVESFAGAHKDSGRFAVWSSISPWVEMVLLHWGVKTMPLVTVDYNVPEIRQVEELAALDQASLAHMYARGEAFFDVIVTFSGIEHGK